MDYNDETLKLQALTSYLEASSALVQLHPDQIEDEGDLSTKTVLEGIISNCVESWQGEGL